MVMTYNAVETLSKMPTQKLSAEILAAAIEGFEAQKRRIDGQIAELRQLLHGPRTEAAPAASPARKRKRKMSAAGRKAISEATKKRWAAFHAAKEAAKPALTKRPATEKAAKRVV